MQETCQRGSAVSVNFETVSAPLDILDRPLDTPTQLSESLRDTFPDTCLQIRRRLADLRGMLR